MCPACRTVVAKKQHCWQCGAALPQHRNLSARALEVSERCKQRWAELQTQASATQKQAQSLVRQLLKYMDQIGAPMSLFAVTPYDIVCFFMEKDLRGRTVVHDSNCEWSRAGVTKNSRKCQCSLRLHHNTLDTQIGLLRGVFRDLGLPGPWCYRLNTGNPCDAKEVKLFYKLSGKEQLVGGVTVRQAPLFDRSVFEQLQTLVLTDWSISRRAGDHVASARSARDALFFSLMWCTGLRCQDTLRLLKQNVEPAALASGPTTRCWYLHVAGTKTELLKGRTFQLFDDGSRFVPMSSWSAYGASLNAIGLSWAAGPMFRELADDGNWSRESTYDDLSGRFKSYVSRLGLPTSMTLQGFHGSHAMEREAEGVPRVEVCREMSWTEGTRAHYVDGRAPITMTDAVPILSVHKPVSKTGLGMVIGGPHRKKD
jgi:hypothetical protein